MKFWQEGIEMKIKLAPILGAVLIIGLFFTGCNNNKTPNIAEENPTAAENHLPGKETGLDALELPEIKTDIIALEGDDHSFTFTRFQAENLGLIAYIPEDLVAEAASSDEGDSVIINSNFVGIKRTDVYLSFLLYAEETTLAKAIEQTRTEFEQKGYEFRQWEAQEYHVYPWAENEFLLTKYDHEPRYVGFVAFGNKGNRVLRVLRHMPEEFSEGFYPRTEKILTDLEWYQ
jgi:hypothetical protein